VTATGVGGRVRLPGLKPALAGVALGAAAWVLGMDVGHAGAIALTGAGVAVVVGSVMRAPDPTWPDDPDAAAGRGWHGAALQSRLLERLDAEPDRVQRLLLPRLRGLLVAALARQGVADPRSPQARQLVGVELYDLLDRPTWPGDLAVTATDLTAAVLARLDELDAVHPRGAATQAREERRP